MGAFSRMTVLLAAAAYSSLVTADPATPRITSITYSGNGCPNNPDRSGDFNGPTFAYRRFVAAYPGTNQTVNCEVHIQATGASAGWQVALSDNWIKGHVVLDPGTQLDYWTTSYFSQDAANTGTVQNKIVNNGASTTDQAVTLHQDCAASRVWSLCIGDDGSPGILNVNFRGALSGGGKGYFEVFTESWDFDWRRC
ncbi:hypothetical protein QBC46DRAFT_264707 [Diplogelasinospora grovesii]|uniref:Secreted protein n=1 Tax=Diplogelasinospora grovesii TaxID=303347 RepID=A0AAN6S327_9PEZI|nr:hypothetical protein QBC46DRAFT_264707 [Diplogelasinospora grovesii]